MSSAILSGITRGFTANQVLRTIARQFPKLENKIYNAAALGYTANQILRSIHNNNSKEQRSEEDFLTEFEKTKRSDDKRKRNRALTAIGVLGTVGALGAVGYGLLQRNKAIQPSEILAAPIKQKGIEGAQLPLITRQGPNTPKGPNSPSPTQPITPNTPQGSNPPSSINPNTPKGPNSSLMTPRGNIASPLKDLLPRDKTTSISLVNNFKQDQRFKNMISQGHDSEITSELLKLTMPKDIVKIMEKQSGGLQGIVEDYQEHLNQIEPQEQQISPNESMQQPDEQMQQSQQTPKLMPQQNVSPQVLDIDQSQTPAGPLNSNPIPFNETSQQIQAPISKPDITPFNNEPEYEPETDGNLVLLPKGEIGSLESVQNGIAKVNIDGKVLDKKLSDLSYEPEGTEQAVRHIFNSIPEDMKSSNFESIIYAPLPGQSVTLVKFYSGKIAWYLGVPEETYKKIAAGLYEPKTQGRTSIAEFKPGQVDSRGAGFSKEIKYNPKYSKENQGKTWGYASNDYQAFHLIQKTIEKVSKERLDKDGNVIVPKKKETIKKSKKNDDKKRTKK